MARRSDNETEGAALELVTTDGFRSGVHGAALAISPSISGGDAGLNTVRWATIAQMINTAAAATQIGQPIRRRTIAGCVTSQRTLFQTSLSSPMLASRAGLL